MIAVQLTRGYWATVDEEDFEIVCGYTWQTKINPDGSPYAVHVRNLRPGSLHIGMHRLISGATEGQLVDHCDGDGLNNRRNNLRICNYQQNSRHRERYVRRKRERGGYLGVSYNKRVSLWVSSIHAGAPGSNGESKRISLRCYATAEEAARVYDAAARYYFGEFAALNFPEEDSGPFDLSMLRGTTTRSAEKRAADSRDGLQRWREKTGRSSPRAKLTPDDVKLVRSGTVPLTELASRLGVSIGHLYRLRSGIK